MDRPRVSVVIPVFNRRATLRRAISSVLGQTMDDYEIIVVDDASTDDTYEVAAQIREPSLRVIRHDANKGPAAARNTGIAAARGSYVAFLDSDDEWLPDKLAIQTEFLDAQPPRIAASCTRHFVSLGRDAPSWRRMLPLEMDWRFYLINHGCDLSPGSTLMVRRDVFDTAGLFNPDLRRYEDWDWLLRYLCHYELAITPETLAVINLSSVPPSDRIAQAASVFIPRWVETARSQGVVAYRRFRSRFYLEIAKSQILEGKRRAGLLNILRCVALWPFHPPRTALSLLRYLSGLYTKPFSSSSR